MNPKQTGGYLFLFVAFLSMCLQLPQDIHTNFTFGFFGSETNLPDPDCNAIAPKLRNCTDRGINCKELPYIAGPQSADVGGVNIMRFDKTGLWIDCRDSKKGGSNPPCYKVEPYQQTVGNCKQVKVTEDN